MNGTKLETNMERPLTGQDKQMKFTISLLSVLLVSGTVNAQCVNGTCARPRPIEAVGNAVGNVVTGVLEVVLPPYPIAHNIVHRREHESHVLPTQYAHEHSVIVTQAQPAFVECPPVAVCQPVCQPAPVCQPVCRPVCHPVRDRIRSFIRR